MILFGDLTIRQSENEKKRVERELKCLLNFTTNGQQLMTNGKKPTAKAKSQQPTAKGKRQIANSK